MDNEATAAVANFAPILVMLLIFYFLLYRPQKKARQERDAMLSSLKVGSRVITIGGIYGTIVGLTNEIVRLKVADKVEIEVARGSINGVAPEVNLSKDDSDA
ncbi:MAG: preprotein translocase subunit YajC [Selenomonadaceae bacterium]|nr:preprotein translocase subunit YajC [Selenomonadaceae bacterium]